MLPCCGSLCKRPLPCGCPGHGPAQSSPSSPPRLSTLLGHTLPHPWRPAPRPAALSAALSSGDPLLASHPTLLHGLSIGSLIWTCKLLCARGRAGGRCSPLTLPVGPGLTARWVLAVRWACSCFLQAAGLPGNVCEVAAAAAGFVMQRGRMRLGGRKGDFFWQEEERMFLACRSLSGLGCVREFQTGRSRNEWAARGSLTCCLWASVSLSHLPSVDSWRRM